MTDASLTSPPDSLLGRLSPLVSAVEEEIENAERALDRVDDALPGLLDTIARIEEHAPHVVERWREDETADGQIVRRLERAGRRRAGLGARQQAERVSLTVPELAAALAFTESKTYRFLDDGRFPGAFQTGGKGTQWHIPADAPERFREQGTERRR